MWERRTFHDCAEELLDASESFKAAYSNRFGWDEARRKEILSDSSRRGREILQILALSVRVEQDIGLTKKSDASVGVIRVGVSPEEQRDFVLDYRPPYAKMAGFVSLKLRDGLNKIAHHEPQSSGFYVDENYHELTLVGTEQNKKKWMGVLSLSDLARAVKQLPDHKVPESVKGELT